MVVQRRGRVGAAAVMQTAQPTAKPQLRQSWLGLCLVQRLSATGQHGKTENREESSAYGSVDAGAIHPSGRGEKTGEQQLLRDTA